MNDDSLNDNNAAEFEQTLAEFRVSAAAEAERPESFWKTQRHAILDRTGQGKKSPAWRPIIAWGTTLAVVITVAGLWFGRTRALPPPDFAAGYDQELLVDVERLTAAHTSLALEPAQLLARDIGAAAARQKTWTIKISAEVR